MPFRPYYACVHVKHNTDNTGVETQIEKCYVDAPDTWSEQARKMLRAKGVCF